MTHESVLKDRYFRWLCDFLGWYSEEDLLGQLYDTPFIWVVPNDANRAEDGLDLRDRLLQDHKAPLRLRNLLSDDEVSVLEVLAALALRASFLGDQSLEEWFVIFLENLGLKEESCDERRVDAILTDWMTRNIEPNGVGGLFPLEHPPEDQRKTEIWYQMNAYIQEDMEASGFFD